MSAKAAAGVRWRGEYNLLARGEMAAFVLQLTALGYNPKEDLGFGDGPSLMGRVDRRRRVLNRRVDTGTPAATGAGYRAPRPAFSSPIAFRSSPVRSGTIPLLRQLPHLTSDV